MNKIFVFTAFVFLLGFVSAVYPYNDYASKWQLCSALNYSGEVCDSYWENISDFKNFGFNESNYYNSSEIDSFLDDLEDEFEKQIENSTSNITINTTNENFVSVEDWEESKTDYEDSFEDIYDKLDDLEDDIKDNNGNNTDYGIVIFVIIVAGVIVGFFIMSKKKPTKEDTKKIMDVIKLLNKKNQSNKKY